MIKEFEVYHGVVFSKLIHDLQATISIKPYLATSNASYVLNEKVGIYIKYSSKRLTPWQFSFKKEHQDEIKCMANSLNKVFLLLVCGRDGVLTLSYEELKTILDENHGQMEWIRAIRFKNQEYSVNGSDGELNYKIGKSDFAKKIATFL